MIEYLKHFIGTPYKFGGNVTQDGGIDCSALILEGLRSEGMWNKTDATAQNIFDNLKLKCLPKGAPGKNCLLFFGTTSQSITHIAIAMDSIRMLEAGGNDKDGMVRIRPIKWRKDLVAVLQLELD